MSTPATERPRIRVWVFWIYTALLMTATHVPARALPTVELVWFDKYEHAGAYFVWTALLLWSGLLGDGPPGRRAARAVACAAILAVLDELFQLIPALNRVGDPIDAAADVFGSVCAACAFWWWTRNRKSGEAGG